MSQLLPYKEASLKADALLQQMNLQEKIDMLGGTRGFFTQSIERLNIPEVMMSDASAGVNIRETWLNDRVDTDLEKSVAFPAPIQLAATWNPGLAEDYARSIGEECRAAGIAILLGPGMNIYRQSQAGRNFEYLGEDPHLASRMVERYVTGLQSTGVAATLKHFIANNTDYFRRKSNSIIDERTLHEIYLPAFKAGIDAGARAVMTAYNLFNGEWCSQNKTLISEILRKDLGFSWLVMTDWWAIDDAEKAVHSGLDLEMPAREVLSSVEELLKEQKISQSEIDRMVHSILTTCISMDFYRKDLQDKSLLNRFDTHEEIALQTAREGIVLLKNRNQLLPLENKEASILLTGKFTEQQAKGGGAADVKGFNHRTLKEALTLQCPGSISTIDSPADKEIKEADLVIISTGTLDNEGWDRPFALPDEEEQQIRRICSLNPNTLVLVQAGGGIRMTDWAEEAAAIIYGWYGGQKGTEALAEVITGVCNPSGKLPITIEKEFTDSPGYGYIPEGEALYNGWNDQEEKKRKVYDVPYKEGIFVGYRWYDKKKIEPLFPFGFGLSYSQFKLTDFNLYRQEKQAPFPIKLDLNIKNISEIEGAETIQIYIRECSPSLERPDRELKAFQKVFLKKGEQKAISFLLNQEAFSYWDSNLKAWHCKPGKFDILVGTSSRNIHWTGSVEL